VRPGCGFCPGLPDSARLNPVSPLSTTCVSVLIIRRVGSSSTAANVTTVVGFVYRSSHCSRIRFYCPIAVPKALDLRLQLEVRHEEASRSASAPCRLAVFSRQLGTFPQITLPWEDNPQHTAVRRVWGKRTVSFLAPLPTAGDHVDETHKNAGGMKPSGNFSLSCDIK
jgi:hypothetical protein